MTNILIGGSIVVNMAEFMDVLDFILNRCTIREIDAVEAAVKRRRSDLGAVSIDPQKAAAVISKTVNDSVASGIAGMQNSIRGMARSLVLKENPDIDEKELEMIVDNLVPDIFQAKPSAAAQALRENKPIAVNGKVNGVPVSAMREMIGHFINFSLGTLRPEEDRALKNGVGNNWTSDYWNAFPAPIKSLIRSYLKNGLSDDVFTNAVDVLLPETE